MTRARHAATLLVALLLALVLVPLAPAGLPGGPSAARAEDDALPVSVTVASVSADEVTPTGAYVVTGTLRNTGTRRLVGVAVALRVAPTALADRTQVQQWPAEPSTGYAGRTLPSTRVSLTGPVEPGASVPFRLTAAGADLAALLGSTPGPRGASVAVTAEGSGGTYRAGLARTFLLWRPAGSAAPAPVEVSVVVPLQAADGHADLTAPDDTLAGELAPGGRLDRLVAGSAGRAVTWVLDPALLEAAQTVPAAAATTPPAGTATSDPSGTPTGPASGGPSDGPGADEEPVTWARRVVDEAARHQVLALGWGDPDVAALAHAGSTGLLDRAGDRAAGALEGAGVADAARAAWPAGGSLDAATASALTATGTTLVLVEDRALRTAAGPGVPTVGAVAITTAAGRLAGVPVDTSASGRFAGLAARDGVRRDTGELVALRAELAAASAEAGRVGAGEPPHVTVALPRGAAPSQAGLAEAVDLLAATPWVRLGPVPTALDDDAPDAATLAAQDAARDELPAVHVRTVAATVDRAAAFSPALVEPDTVLAPTTARALSLVSTAWRAGPVAALAADRARLGQSISSLYDAVTVVRGSRILLLGSSADLPLRLSNASDQRLRVAVSLRPRSGQLRASDPVVVEVRPGSDATAVVPVRTVANGDLTVEVAVAVPAGPTISASTLAVRVRRDWESRGLAVAGGGLAVLLVVGIVRSLRRRGSRLRPEDAPDFDLVAAEEEDRLRRTGRPGAEAGGHVLPDHGTSDAAVQQEQDDDVPPPAHEGGPGTRQEQQQPQARRAVRPSPRGLGRHVADRRGARGRTEDNGDDGDDGGPARTAPLPADGDHAPRAVAAATPGGGDVEVDVARSSALMAAGTLVSRILGFVRTSLLAAAIGAAGQSADAFSVANTIPNIVYMLLAGSVLNAVLVPAITRAARQGEAGRLFVDRLVTMSVAVMVVVTVAVTLAAPWFVDLYTSGRVTAEQLDLSVAFAYWCLPQVLFYGLYMVWGQVLNARGAFGAYTWAPVVNNVVAIAGLLVYVWVAGFGRKPADVWDGGTVTLLAGTATLGIVAQALFLVPFLRRSGYRWRPRWGLRGSGLRTAGTMAAWTFAAVVVAQLAFPVTTNVLTGAGQLAGASDDVAAGKAIYDSSYLLFMLPHSIVTVSLVTALFTRMSDNAGTGDVDAVRSDLSLGLRVSSLVMIPAGAFMLAAGPLVAAVLFPAQTAAEHRGIGYGAAAMMSGLAAFSAQYLMHRVFYAYEDARTPFFAQTPAVALGVLGMLAVGEYLPPQWAVAGVGAVMAGTSLIGMSLTAWLLRRRLDGLDGRRVVGVVGRALLAAATAAAVTHLVVDGTGRWFESTLPGTWGARIATLLLALAVMGTLYVAALRVLRVREVADVAAPVAARLRRRR